MYVDHPGPCYKVKQQDPQELSFVYEKKNFVHHNEICRISKE